MWVISTIPLLTSTQFLQSQTVEWVEECQVTLMDFVGHQGTGKQGPLAQSPRCENSVAVPL